MEPEGPTAQQANMTEQCNLKLPPQGLTNWVFPFLKSICFEVDVPTACGMPQLRPGI